MNILVAQQNNPCNHPIIKKGLKDINSLTNKELVLFQLKYEECNQYKNKLEESKIKDEWSNFLSDNAFCIFMILFTLYNLSRPAPDLTPDFPDYD